jgi:hypothetical protein
LAYIQPFGIGVKMRVFATVAISCDFPARLLGSWTWLPMDNPKTAPLPILLIDILRFSLRRHALKLSDLISCQEGQSIPIRNRDCM